MKSPPKFPTEISYPLLELVAKIEPLRRTARKHNKSLTGANHYARKYADLRILIEKEFRALDTKLSQSQPVVKDALLSIKEEAGLLLSTTTSASEISQRI